MNGAAVVDVGRRMVRLEALSAGTAFRVPALGITGTVEHSSDTAVRVMIQRRPGGAFERTEWATGTEVSPGDAADEAVNQIRECICHAGAGARTRDARRRTVRRPVTEDTPVTFAQFARAGRRLGWSLPFLTRQFRGRIDGPAEFFARVFERHDRHGSVVIPYRSVIEFYVRELAYARGQKVKAA
jgi:hypothetical protein